MSAGPPLVDLMVAATLVAASLTVLFSVWQPTIDDALAVQSSDDKDNNRARRTKVQQALVRRALPLAASASALFGVLAHRALPILSTLSCGLGCRVDDLQALYLVNAAVIALLLTTTLAKAWQLVLLLRKLSG